MKNYIVIFFLLLLSSAYAQNNLNDYKYIITPERFSFQKLNDQYGLNSAIKQLLENKGFTVYFDDTDLPTEIATNKCVALNVDLLDKSGMFTTKLAFVLKDCRGNVVYQSAVGSSREKEFETGYNEALKGAFASFNKVSYAYNGSNGKIQAPTPAVKALATPAENPAPQTKSVKTDDVKLQAGTLYAQPIANGYQLIDITPKKVLTLFKTSAVNYFIASNDAFSGIVFKVDDNWVFEYYNNNKLVSEKLIIKF